MDWTPCEISNFKFHVPTKNHFRLQDCGFYKKISGQYVCEMDFCWWDGSGEFLYLLEAWDFKRNDKAEKQFDKLFLKGIDSLLLLASVWLNTKRGLKLSKDFPQTFPCRISDNLKLIFVLRIPPDLKEHLGPLMTQLKSKFSQRIAQLNAEVALCDRETLSSLKLRDFKVD